MQARKMTQKYVLWNLPDLILYYIAYMFFKYFVVAVLVNKTLGPVLKIQLRAGRPPVLYISIFIKKST